MPVTAINSHAEFKEIIASGKPVAIDFWATWCGPCRMISPVFEQLAHLPEYSHVGFYKVDVDQQEEISQEVAIRSMPTFLIFHNGVQVDQLVGAHPPSLKDLINRAATI